jgi:methylenetetrahydrofolate reductase (NADPH)
MTGSLLKEKLERGEFAVTGEIGPPKSASGEDILARAKMIKGCADAYNITDNQTATVRLSSLAGSVFIMKEGMEPILQMTCRDRNRIALQSDVLGANALGIRNILCLSGDHQCFGNQPDTKNVYDVDSTQEIMIFKRMRDEGTLWSGDRLKVAPDLYLGAVSNPFGDPREMHVMRLRNKVSAGAQFIQTQSVFDLDAFESWVSEVRRDVSLKDVKILAGMLPLRTLKAARYMAESVPGTCVPPEIVRRMAAAPDEEKEGQRIASEILDGIRDMKGVSGVHIMPVNWYSAVRPLLERAGLLTGHSLR